jgi:hemoglobin
MADEKEYRYMRRNLIVLAVSLAFLCGVAAPLAAADGHMKEKSLYSRLGGKKGIAAVVDEFVNNVANDSRINRFFADAAKDPARMAAFKQKLNAQICGLSGGPCKYHGKDMKTAHRGMGISDADFTALVEDLVKALDKLGVKEKEKNELLGALGPMKGDIVGQ